MDPAAQNAGAIPPPPPGYGAPTVVPPPPAGFGPVTVAGATSGTASPQPAATPDLSSNPGNEGMYKMRGPQGMVSVPYSKVEAAKDAGFDFDWAHSNEGERYGNDQMADPNRERDFMERLATGGMDTFKAHAAGAVDLFRKLTDETSKYSDAADYQRKNPGATPDQAMAAVEGKDINSLVTGQPYRSDTSIKADLQLRHAADWLRKQMSGQDNGVAGWLGAAGENVGELLGPSELMKLGAGPEVAGDVASAADKMQAGAKIANVLKNHPVINRLVGLGIRALKTGVQSAAIGGAQTYVDTGGDTDQAAEAAGLAGAGGTALHVAGEGTTMGARALLAKLASPVTAADAVTDAARGVLGERLDATNDTRILPGSGRTRFAPALPPSTGDFEFHIGGTPTEETKDGATAFDARKRQTGTRILPGKGPASGVAPYDASGFEYGGGQTPAAGETPTEQPAGSHKSPQFQYLTDTKPGSPPPATDAAAGGGALTTTDADLAAAHLKNLKEVIADPAFAELTPEQQTAIQGQHDDMQQQLADYYKHQKATGTYAPNFQPVDVKAAINATGDFGQAADHLHNTAVEVYDHANKVTGGQWQALDQHITNLQAKLADEPFVEGRAALRQQINQAQRTMSDILEDPRNGFDATDVQQAKANFRAKYVLQDAQAAVKPLFAGVEEQTGLTTGQYRGFNGKMVGQRWDEFMKANPSARQILGSDRVDTLQRVFDANGNMAARKRFGNAIASVGMALAGYHLGGFEGGVAAESAYQGIRYALRGVVGNPKVAKSLLFAIDSGARPESYAPGLAKIIRNTVPAAAGGIVRGLNDQPQSEEKQ